MTLKRGLNPTKLAADAQQKDHIMAEEELNKSLGCLGSLVKDMAGATYSRAACRIEN